MSTIIASAIIGKAQILSQDTTAIRWSLPEWLGWLNDGQREICIFRPMAYTKIANVTFVAGTKQAIPADGIEFLEFIRNMGVSGSTPGNAARKVPRRLLDSSIPGWHAIAGTAVVQHYVFDPLSPKTFYVYPPSLGTSQAEILYSANPVDVASQATAISIDDIYAGPLLDYILFRAFSNRKQFESTLGIKSTTDAGVVAAIGAKG
jgi:hypothetical protein